MKRFPKLATNWANRGWLTSSVAMHLSFASGTSARSYDPSADGSKTNKHCALVPIVQLADHRLGRRLGQETARAAAEVAGARSGAALGWHDDLMAAVDALALFPGERLLDLQHGLATRTLNAKKHRLLDPQPAARWSTPAFQFTHWGAFGTQR